MRPAAISSARKMAPENAESQRSCRPESGPAWAEAGVGGSGGAGGAGMAALGAPRQQRPSSSAGPAASPAAIASTVGVERLGINT